MNQVIIDQVNVDVCRSILTIVFTLENLLKLIETCRNFVEMVRNAVV